MKNAKLVLFAMIFSAPLVCMNGSDVQPRFVKEIREEGVVCFYDTTTGKDLSVNEVNVICDDKKFTSSDIACATNSASDDTKSAMHKKNSAKLLQVSGLSALALGGSIVAQKYAGSNSVVSNPKFAQFQLALCGSAVTTGALAADEALKGYCPNVVHDSFTAFYNLIFGASQAKTASRAEASLTDLPKSQAAVKKAAWLNSRNICVASTVACLATCGAQRYTGSKDVNLARAQMATGCAALASGATAVAYSQYPTRLWNLMFGAHKK